MRVISWLLASTTSAFLLRGGPCITNTAMSVFRGGIADGDPARLERDALTRRFLAAFGDDTNPVVVAFAPGRANLIGEHTDYQDGLVMPFALDVGVYVAFRERDDDALNVFAEDFNAWGATTLGAVRAARAADPAYGPAMDPKWLRYVAAPFDWLEEYLVAKRAVERRLATLNGEHKLRASWLRPSLVYTFEKPAALPAVFAFVLGNAVGIPFVDRPVTVDTLARAAVRALSDGETRGCLDYEAMERLANLP